MVFMTENKKNGYKGTMTGLFNAENRNIKSILHYIAENGFEPDDRLPSERELATNLGISRNSLREAMKILETLGVVEIIHGSGTYLRKTNIEPGDDGSTWLVIHKDEIFKMITIREALDLCAVELIPEEDYPLVRQQMRDSIARVRKTSMTNEDMLQHDLEFHNIVRKAAGNDILLKICVSLTGNIYDERKVLFDNEKRVKQSIEEHNRIANAFGSMDVNEVKQAYVAHFASTRASIESAGTDLGQS